MIFYRTTPILFAASVDAARKVLGTAKGGSLAPISAEVLADGFQCFATKDLQAGFCISPSGEVCNIFSTVKGNGEALIKAAVAVGATHLNCFDGYLPTLYAKHGFKETERMAFDWQYAPAGWLPEFGTPDVVTMVLEG